MQSFNTPSETRPREDRQGNSATNTPDQKYIENQVMAEKAQLWHRAMYEQRQPQFEDQRHEQALDTPLSSINQLYRPPQPSNMSPMQRFLSPSIATDPSGLLFRKELKEAGIRAGSVESIGARYSAATRQDKSMKNGGASKDWSYQAQTGGASSQDMSGDTSLDSQQS